MTKIPVYSIDSNVPMPEKTTRVRTIIPVDSLEVGESIQFPSSKLSSVAPLASRLKAKEGKVFVVKKVDDNNHRVWRVE